MLTEGFGSAFAAPASGLYRLSLMTYHGVVLLLSGYQADEQHILRQYRAIVDKCVIPLASELV